MYGVIVNDYLFYLTKFAFAIFKDKHNFYFYERGLR